MIKKLIDLLATVLLSGRGPTARLISVIIAGTGCYVVVRRWG